MASHTAQPQPGDGAFLLNSNQPSTHGRGHRRRRRNKHSFLTAVDGGEDNQCENGNMHGGKTPTSFLQNDNGSKKDADDTSSPTPLPTPRLDTPRTLGNETSSSHPLAAVTSSSPAPATANATARAQTGDSNYITSQSDMDGTSLSSVPSKQSLAPPLAKKFASSSGSKVDSKQGSSAGTQQNKSRGDKTESASDLLKTVGVTVHKAKTANVTSTGASAHGWNAPAPSAEPAVQKPKPSNTRDRVGNANGNRGRGQARGGGNSFAAARAEIPKTDPKRWDTNWNTNARKSWDSSSLDSWGGKKQRAGQTASPPQGDWNGKLAPPPPDWDSRPGFRVDQSYTQIMDWMSEIEHKMCGVNEVKVPMDPVTAADGTTFVFALSTMLPDQPSVDPKIRQMGEIVPQYWVDIVIGDRAPQVFWTELLKSSAPLPDDPVDLVGAKPWWERFVKGEQRLSFLQDPPCPKVVGIDPDQETAEQTLRRKHDLGSAKATDNRVRYEQELQQARLNKKKRMAEKKQRLAAMEVNSNAPTNRSRIKPGFKLHVRSAKADDMGAVKDIYNHYIENSTSVPELERLDREEMVARYRQIRARNLPFLVAYKPGGIIKAPRNKKNQQSRPTRDDVQLPDTIVGFAFADDYDKGMYRFTAKIEFYTRDTDYMNGVASCLVDKLMCLLDSTYQERGGYEVVGDDIDGLSPARTIKNIIVNLPHEKFEKLVWFGRWLEAWLKFRNIGTLDNIGTKNGKAVSLAIFQRETGIDLDYGNPVPL